VATEELEHVVEEPEAGHGLDVPAVEVDGDDHVGLAGLAVDLSGAWHGSKSRCSGEGP
jgi:hypothetical protein